MQPIHTLKLETKEEVTHALEQYDKLSVKLNDYRAENPLENIDGVVNYILACIRELNAILIRDYKESSEEEKKDANIAVNQSRRDIEDNLEPYEKFMKDHPELGEILSQ